MTRTSALSAFKSPQIRDTYRDLYNEQLRRWPAHTRTMIPGRFGRTGVLITGDPAGPPMVLLHGRYTPSPAWSPIIHGLAQRFRVHAIDTMGEPGLSDNNGTAIRSGDDYLDWLDETVDALGIAPAHVVGHSFGGWIAARYALRHPRRARTLTLLDPAQVFAPFSPRWLLACVRPYLWPTPGNVERLMRWLGQRRPDHDDAVALAVDGMTGFRMKAPEASLISKHDLADLQVPTQQLIADGSVVHRPLSAIRRAEKFAPTVRSIVVEDASHFLFHDQPEAVLRAFDRVIESPPM